MSTNVFFPVPRSRLTAAGMLVLLALCLAALPLSAQTPRKYALLIGLNEYLHVGSGITQLQFAVHDVEALEEVFESAGFDSVTVLANERAERGQIVAHLYRIAQLARPQDTFVLFFAGHGVRNQVVNDETYWLTNDARLSPLDEAGIRLTHLLDYVRDIKAERKLLLLDHCFSGDVTRAAAPADGGIRDGSGSEVEISNRGSFRVNEFRQTLESRSSGMVILAAAREGAQESASLTSKDRDGNERVGHGLFTYALLKALGSREADTGGDGSLTLGELAAFLPDKMQTVAAEHGLASQELTEITDGTNIATWELVASLPVDDAQERKSAAADYRTRLIDWQDRGLIDFDTRIECFSALSRWEQEDGPALSQLEEEILEECRMHLDSDAPEGILGPDLVDQVQRLKGDG